MILKRKKGFTLIELLTVIAIIGILAAILIPAVGAAKTAANKAKTKVQFNQWATAMSLFKQEYGYYPTIDDGSKKVVPATFFAALTAKTYSGGTPSDYKGNIKHISFYSTADSEVTAIANGDAVDGSLKDAFGNTDIAVFMDSNSDGVIDGSDAPAFSAVGVTSINTGLPLTPTFAATSVRAGVIFYSAGKGSSVNDIVYSWQ